MPGRLIIGKPTLPPARVEGLTEELELAYAGSNGKATTRRFTLHSASGHQEANGTITLDAVAGYCHLRKMARTFRLDRIISVADADGVVIADLGAWILARAGN